MPPSSLPVAHPTWCDQSRCDVNGVDPIHVGPPATAHLEESGLDVEAFVYRLDEHNIHTWEPTGPVYGVELHVPVDNTDAAFGAVRIQLGGADVTTLQVLLAGRAAAQEEAVAADEAADKAKATTG